MGKKSKAAKKAAALITPPDTPKSEHHDQPPQIALKKEHNDKLPQIALKKEYYEQPQSSPYESPPVTIAIGSKNYSIPACYLRKNPQWDKDFKSSPSVLTLFEADEEIGHTIIHFLYTGGYETLQSETESDASYIVKEYNKSVKAYYAAKVYNLEGLEALAKKYMEIFGAQMSIGDILQAAKPVRLKFLNTEDWFRGYIKDRLRAAYEVDETVFKSDGFYSGIGEDRAFGEAVTKMVVDIYATEIASLRNALEDQITKQEVSGLPADEKPPVDEGFVEGSDANIVEDAPTEECPVDPPVEDDPTDVPTKEAPTEDASAEDTYAKGAATEEASTADAPGEAAAAEDYPIETPAWSQWNLDQ